MASTYLGWFYLWEDGYSGLLTSDSDEPLRGTWEVWLRERTTKKGANYTGGPIGAPSGDPGECSLVIGPYMDTRHGRRRVLTMTLDGSQGAKSWMQFGHTGRGEVSLTKLETDEARTERFAIQNADTGTQWDDRGRLVRKGSPERMAEAKKQVKASRANRSGGSGPVTDADIPFCS